MALRSNQTPILHPVIQTDDQLERFYTTCAIRSVHYFKDPKDRRLKALVLLAISWEQTENIMCTYSSVTTRVTGQNIIALEATPAQEEGCPTATIIRKLELSFNSKLPFLNMLLRYYNEKKEYAMVYLDRRTGPSNLEIQWHVRSQNSPYFPQEVNLLLKVESDLETEFLPFPFNLEIPPNIRNKRRSRSWIPIWMRLKKAVHQPKDGHQGWECLIDSNYNSVQITNLQAPIGLQAAIDAHLARLP